MRPPVLRLHLDEQIVDGFAGGGGASLGIRMATGREPDVAMNHDAEALAMHEANHPGCRHLLGNIWDQNPRDVAGGRPVGLAWFSPDCTFHSKARGGKPFRDRNPARRRRGLAWVVVRWAREVRPRIICLENVEEFADWGPLDEDGKPDPAKRGFTFRRWVVQLENCGYQVESRELRACDHGAPTSRKRLFVVARCDGQPIVWPETTHGPGRAEPFRVAADCIDWSIPCPSIFARTRPLAENTLRRIARGIRRYVIEAAQPFIVPVSHTGVRPSGTGIDARTHSLDEPMPTITGASRGNHALVAPLVARIGQTNGGGKYANACDEPVTTVTTKAEHLLVAPTLVQTGYGEREGQAPRALDLQRPLGTVVGGGQKHALVAAFLAKHYGGGYEGPGAPLDEPAHTVPTVRAQGTHLAEVRAFLIAYYGVDQNPQLGLPMATVTTKHRFGLVTIHGVDYAIVDIGMRMLQPRELFRAQGFPDSYRIDDFDVDGATLTKTAQVRMCGNSVCPPLAAALVRAQLAEPDVREAVA